MADLSRHERGDEELMLAWAAGDGSAFEVLYDRHRRALYGFIARSVGAAGDAAALYQDVWMKVIGARERYRPEAKFTTWLFQIARNRLADHWRRQRPTETLDPEREAGDNPGPEAGLVQDQRRQALVAAIATLPPEQREVLLLRLEQGFTVPQIAEVVGIDPEAAKSRLRYAIDKLRRQLAPQPEAAS